MQELFFDKIVSTCLDSFNSKYMACKLGYFSDPYLPIFCRSLETKGFEPRKKSNIINRGYFARFKTHSMALENFVNIWGSSLKQIVYLGCGFDTYILNILSKDDNVLVFEIDFGSIISIKFEIYNENIEINQLLKNYNIGTNINDVKYKIGPITLISEDLKQTESVKNSLIKSGFNPSIPTLFISECVLVYIPKDPVLNLCKELLFLPDDKIDKKQKLPKRNIFWLSYDMINPSDNYGKMMLKNISNSGISIPGIVDFPTLNEQKNRFLQTGWNFSNSSTMLQFYNSMVPEKERLLIEEIQPLDEMEEWKLIMSHYSVTLSVYGDHTFNFLNIFN